MGTHLFSGILKARIPAMQSFEQSPSALRRLQHPQYFDRDVSLINYVYCFRHWYRLLEYDNTLSLPALSPPPPLTKNIS